MSIEAMKQALEAWDAYDGGTLDHPMAAVMEALRAAIEQAEKQEPVAWLYVNADMPTNRQLEWTEARQGYAGNWFKYPLYTAPRQWVGLTNEEIEAVMQGSVEGERMLPYQFARAIEAKLKGKA
jgi:hypothetical protein